MHFESECLFHSVGEVSGDAAKLRVTKGISGAASIGNEAPIIAADTFAGDYYAPTDSVDYLLDFRQKCCFVVGAFREQDDVGASSCPWPAKPAAAASQPAWRPIAS